jgi:hypothetical protein
VGGALMLANGLEGGSFKRLLAACRLERFQKPPPKSAFRADWMSRIVRLCVKTGSYLMELGAVARGHGAASYRG